MEYKDAEMLDQSANTWSTLSAKVIKYIENTKTLINNIQLFLFYFERNENLEKVVRFPCGLHVKLFA